MSQTVIKIHGSAGRLKAGGRPAASLGKWEARHIDGQRWSFEFESYEPDPYWFEHGSTFTLILNLGRGEVRGRCDIVSRDPLICEMEIPA